jgi:hypothetical protein
MANRYAIDFSPVGGQLERIRKEREEAKLLAAEGALGSEVERRKEGITTTRDTGLRDLDKNIYREGLGVANTELVSPQGEPMGKELAMIEGPQDPRQVAQEKAIRGRRLKDSYKKAMERIESSDTGGITRAEIEGLLPKLKPHQREKVIKAFKKSRRETMATELARRKSKTETQAAELALTETKRKVRRNRMGELATQKLAAGVFGDNVDPFDPADPSTKEFLQHIIDEHFPDQQANLLDENYLIDRGDNYAIATDKGMQEVPKNLLPAMLQNAAMGDEYRQQTVQYMSNVDRAKKVLGQAGFSNDEINKAIKSPKTIGQLFGLQFSDMSKSNLDFYLDEKGKPKARSIETGGFGGLDVETKSFTKPSTASGSSSLKPLKLTGEALDKAIDSQEKYVSAKLQELRPMLTPDEQETLDLAISGASEMGTTTVKPSPTRAKQLIDKLVKYEERQPTPDKAKIEWLNELKGDINVLSGNYGRSSKTWANIARVAEVTSGARTQDTPLRSPGLGVETPVTGGRTPVDIDQLQAGAMPMKSVKPQADLSAVNPTGSAVDEIKKRRKQAVNY